MNGCTRDLTRDTIYRPVVGREVKNALTKTAELTERWLYISSVPVALKNAAGVSSRTKAAISDAFLTLVATTDELTKDVVAKAAAVEEAKAKEGKEASKETPVVPPAAAVVVTAVAVAAPVKTEVANAIATATVTASGGDTVATPRVKPGGKSEDVDKKPDHEAEGETA